MLERTEYLETVDREDGAQFDPLILNFDTVARAVPLLPGASLPSMTYAMATGLITLNAPGTYVFNLQGEGDYRIPTGTRFCQVRLARAPGQVFLESVSGSIQFKDEPQFFSGTFTLTVTAAQTPFRVQYLTGLPHPQAIRNCGVEGARLTIWRFN